MRKASVVKRYKDAIRIAAYVAVPAIATFITSLLLCMSASLSAQGLPELGNPPTGHRVEDFLPAEAVKYARRKWMWALSDMTGVKALRLRQGLDQPEDQAQAQAREPGWMLFGRIGPLRWQNELGEDNLSALRFGLQHAPPRLSGQAYIGIYRKF